MKYKKILLSLLFVFEGIIATYVSFENDITKRLDTCIVNMLTKVDSDSIWYEFMEMKSKRLARFEHKIDGDAQKAGRLPHRASFRQISFSVTNCMRPRLVWDFVENELRLSFEKLYFNAKGKVRLGKNETYNLHVELRYSNVTINVTGSKGNAKETELSMSEGYLSIEHARFEDYFWSGELSAENGQSISPDRKTELNIIIMEIVPQMLIETFKSTQIFGAIYKAYNNSKNDLISTYPEFETDQSKFYYLIPSVPFYCFNLKRILIRGLSNFRLLKVYKDPKAYTHTLLIHNVTGRMYLDYGISDEVPLKMNFHIEYLTISINKETLNGVNVNARYYFINTINGPLTYRQSPVVMYAIESAIAGAVMPTMKVERTRDVDILVDQIQVTKTSDWKALKKAYKEWIPFNDKTVTKKA